MHAELSTVWWISPSCFRDWCRSVLPKQPVQHKQPSSARPTTTTQAWVERAVSSSSTTTNWSNIRMQFEYILCALAVHTEEHVPGAAASAPAPNPENCLLLTEDSKLNHQKWDKCVWTTSLASQRPIIVNTCDSLLSKYCSTTTTSTVTTATSINWAEWDWCSTKVQHIALSRRAWRTLLQFACESRAAGTHYCARCRTHSKSRSSALSKPVASLFPVFFNGSWIPQNPISLQIF